MFTGFRLSATMAQICTRPARQAAAATTTESVAPVSALNKTQDQHVSTGSNTQTIPKPLALRQSQTLRQKQSLAFAQIMLHASVGHPWSTETFQLFS